MNTYVKIGRKTKKVRNLGWLLRHAGEVESFKIIRRGSEATMIAYLDKKKQNRFVTAWASLAICMEWIKRPSLRHVPVEVI